MVVSGDMYKSPLRAPSSQEYTEVLKLKIIVSTPIVIERATARAATAMLVRLSDAPMLREARNASSKL